jgi:sugar lactone lactonase YvrE
MSLFCFLALRQSANGKSRASRRDPRRAHRPAVQRFVPRLEATLLLAAALAFCVSSARGDFFVGDEQGNNVLRFDNAGNFVGVFVASGSGGLDEPRGLAFGPDGNLYVSSSNNGRILRYDGTTGAFMDAFVPAGSGGLKGPEALIFRDDGFLYVSNFGTIPVPDPFLDGKVTRYDASTGTFDSLYVSSSDTRGNCDGMTFGPNGNLFVAASWRDNPDTQGVLQFDGTDGHFIGQFTQGVDLVQPRGVAFGPDGNLYVTDINSITHPYGDTRVARFDGTTGQYIDDAIPFGQGLDSCRQLGFGPDARLYLASLFKVWVFDITTSRLDVWITGSNLPNPIYFVWK